MVAATEVQAQETEDPDLRLAVAVRLKLQDTPEVPRQEAGCVEYLADVKVRSIAVKPKRCGCANVSAIRHCETKSSLFGLRGLVLPYRVLEGLTL